MAIRLGTDKSDNIFGTDQADLVYAKDGDDTVFTGKGDDEIHAGKGRDVIDAGEGEDHIEGGRGNDIMTGGADADTFEFLEGRSGKDIVTDFETNEDLLHFADKAGVQGFEDLSLANDANGNAVVSWGNESVTLVGVNADDLTADNFDFAG